ncbi:MAG: hypothetical protein HY520_02525 [Candidatus Aenigmarchaeota archaeon]|nr:hypothetical protein [Candidatus Aenigmarchaeota archaeon]
MARLLALLALVVLVAGCTALGGGSGVVIERFDPDFTTVFPGEPLTFRFKVRNTGSFDAGGGDLRLLGMEEWMQGGSDLRCQLPQRLLAPVASAGTPGDTFDCALTATAPQVPQGISVTYRPTARVSYGYQSATLAELTLGTRQEMIARQHNGQPLPAQTTAASRSPIAIAVQPEGPVRVYREGAVVSPLRITVTNVGGGVVCALDEGGITACPTDSSAWNKISITTTLAGQLVEACSRELTLSGGSNTIVCDLEVSDLPAGGIVQKTVEVQSTYGYFTDAERQVTVQWRPGA